MAKMGIVGDDVKRIKNTETLKVTPTGIIWSEEYYLVNMSKFSDISVIT